MTPASERFAWTTLWSEGPGSTEWSHSGIAVLPDGRVVFAAPEGRDLIVLDPVSGQGHRITTPLLEIHGISLDADPDVLLLADPGVKPRPVDDYRDEVRPGAVIRFSLNDGVLQVLDLSDAAEYRGGPWRPTSAVSDSDGAVWIADGYGQSLVHRFSATGEYLFTVDGSESGRAFDCPHGALIDRRHGVERVIIADRGNRRLVVLDLAGRLHHIVEHPLFTSPSSLAARDDTIVITELFGGLLELGADGGVRPVMLPLAPTAHADPWPNVILDGRLVRPTLAAERLHSPHGVAVGPDRSIYLTEWMIGGRQIRLQPLP